MSDLTTIARPYAQAAFDFAVEKNTLNQWSEMLDFAARVASNEQMHLRLTSSTSAKKLAEIFIAVCGDQLDEFGQNLIKVMAENNRLQALPDVYAEFLNLKQEHENKITADVVSATELSEQQQTDIINKLEKRLERKVTLNCSIEPSLLAGMIIRIGDIVFDHSALGRLSQLHQKILS
jgi:F-type H+-transporting ATPase subunit delta